MESRIKEAAIDLLLGLKECQVPDPVLILMKNLDQAILEDDLELNNKLEYLFKKSVDKED